MLQFLIRYVVRQQQPWYHPTVAINFYKNCMTNHYALVMTLLVQLVLVVVYQMFKFLRPYSFTLYAKFKKNNKKSKKSDTSEDESESIASSRYKEPARRKKQLKKSRDSSRELRNSEESDDSKRNRSDVYGFKPKRNAIENEKSRNIQLVPEQTSSTYSQTSDDSFVTRDLLSCDTINRTNSMLAVRSVPHVDRMMMTGHMYIQPPSKFTKKSNVKVWFKAFDNYIKCNNLKNKRDQLIALLDEEVQQLIERYPLSDDQEDGYIQLKRALERIFFTPEKHPSQYEQEFFKRVQLPNEAVNLFFAELTGLAWKTDPNADLEAVKRKVTRQFTIGLSDEATRRKLLEQNVSDPYQALDIALHEADVNALNSFYGNYHKKQEPLNPFAKSYTQEARVIEPRNENKTYQRSNRVENPKVTGFRCYNCDDPGHAYRDCPKAKKSYNREKPIAPSQ
jgi:hypothetical protein